MIPILRTLYAYSTLLTEATLKEIEKTVLGFKYWMDEPGEDSMCYWSENHQLIFGTIELLAGQFYSDKVFYNLPITGRERMERAKNASLIGLSIDINTVLLNGILIPIMKKMLLL